MPTITNFGDVITQGNTITQGTGFSSFAGALNAPTFYGAIAGSNTIAASTVSATSLVGTHYGVLAGSNTIAASTVSAGTSVSAPSVVGTHYGVLAGSNTIAASTVTATTLTGAGSGITSLDMGNAGSGTLALARGGTGTTSAQLAMNALAGAVTNAQYLRGNGTNVVMAAISVSDVPTLNQNTSGTAGGLTGTPNITVGTVGASTITGSADATFNSVRVGLGAGSNATNIAVGANALNVNTTGFNNTAVGYAAMQRNTGGQNNTAVGVLAVFNNKTGQNNTAVGVAAMQLNSTGSNNTAVGVSALYSSASGNDNTALGSEAGYSMSTGTNNTLLGRSSGNDALITVSTQSNHVVLGNNSTTTLYCKTNVINTSDARDKTNIKAIAVGLDYIQKLKPVTFNFDDRGWYPEGQAPDGSKACSINRVGFLAQDILATEQDLGLPFNHVINTDYPEKLAIIPSNIVPILVNAIKELSAQVAALQESCASASTPQ